MSSLFKKDLRATSYEFVKRIKLMKNNVKLQSYVDIITRYGATQNCIQVFGGET